MRIRYSPEKLIQAIRRVSIIGITFNHIVVITYIIKTVETNSTKWFKERRKKALFEALEKVKAELMILGFISLLLTFGQNYISKICIPEKAADTMLPCHLDEDQIEAELAEGGHHRRLRWDATIDLYPKRRFLSAASSVSRCSQIRRWKEWEKEASSPNYEFFNDPSRFRLTHEISFVRQHASFWNRSPILFYAVSFFRQFFRSVRKADYLAMRHGFITVHLAPGSKFDFQKYIKRSLEDDFKVIVGIRYKKKSFAVLINSCSKTGLSCWKKLFVFTYNSTFTAMGWHTMFIISVMPLIIILAVGTKLQAIITRMAVEIQERHAVIQGIPLVQLSDHHFWFGRPQLVLFLIHFTLFQYEFGLNSCFHENNKIITVRVCLGVGVQFVCSYVTLPLYALVSQMGSQMKRSIFDEQTSKALKKWHHQAVKKKNPQKNSPNSPSRSPPPSPRASQTPASKTTRSLSLTPSGRRHYSDPDALVAKAEAPSLSSTTTMVSTVNNTDLLTGSNEDHRNGDEDEFSLVNLTDS
ncbi:MLO-like protein 5 [Cocos nucifera]|uniref:MLO-like protein n=1 Tax=Cocos nucifera TaxID=13894 RepID=A0A8K0N7W6_COCNU|nr:MLO-like protein 5 [Cocos nucifera]